MKWTDVPTDFNVNSYNEDIQDKAEMLQTVLKHMQVCMPKGVFCDLIYRYWTLNDPTRKKVRYEGDEPQGYRHLMEGTESRKCKER